MGVLKEESRKAVKLVCGWSNTSLCITYSSIL